MTHSVQTPIVDRKQGEQAKGRVGKSTKCNPEKEAGDGYDMSWEPKGSLRETRAGNGLGSFIGAGMFCIY